MRLEVTAKMFSKDYSDAISLVLYYVDDEYCKTHPNLPTTMRNKKADWVKALRIAKENGLLHYFSRRLLDNGGELPSNLLGRVIEQEEMSFVKLRETLYFVNSLFKDEGLDFMFIKLYRGISYAPRAVDILVKHKDMLRAISLFKKNGFKVESFSDVEIQCQRADLLKVDLYCGFYYLSLPFIDDEFLWRDHRIVAIEGVDCVVPAFEADFLSLVIHSLLGHGHISLLDFLYAKGLLNSERLSFDKMLKEAEKYGWAHAFTKVFRTLKELHESLYSSPNFPKGIRFPFVYSTKFTFEAFQAFAGLPVDMQTKLFFILSAFLDAAYHKYLNTGQVISMEIPKQLKSIIAKSLYKVRQQRGDRKTSAFSN